MCANLVPEILRAPEERVLVAGAQRRFQPSADSLPCSAVHVLGSCIPTPPIFKLHFFFYTLQQGHRITTHCNRPLKSANKQK